MSKKVLAVRSLTPFNQCPSLLIDPHQLHVPTIPTVPTTISLAQTTTTTTTAPMTTTVPVSMLSALNAATRVTTPENAPIPRGMFRAPMHQHTTLDKAVMEMETARMLHLVAMPLSHEAV